MLKGLGTELKVGAFTLVALGILVYMVFVVDPSWVEDKEYNSYYTILDNAAGIVEKTHVKTNGVTVGRVVRVDLDSNTTKVLLEVEQVVAIPVGSTIEVRSVGILGDVHIEIIRTNSTEFIDDGGFIAQSQDALDMQAVVALVGNIGKDLKKITGVLAEVIGSQEGESQLKNILSNIDTMTNDLRATSETLRSALGDREQELSEIVTNIRAGVGDLREFSSGLREVMDDENRERIDRILASFDDTMEDVKGSARSINLVAERIERGEGTIGRLVNEDNAIAELEAAIKDVREVLSPATKLKISVDYRGEFRQDDTSQDYFNLKFQTRADRYYLLGISNTTYDVTDTTEEVVQDDPADGENGPIVRTVEKTERQSAIKVNLQFAKRWYNLALRFGLFETTGGVAADLYLFRDRFKWSVEAFDFDTSDKTIRRNVHLKTYASVLFYNHVYLLAGIDDPTRTDPETGKVNEEINYFFGAGLTFADDDLKALFGAAALSAGAL